ncbi:MAG: sigma-70 family RNA polymerase sigma factor [Gemmataceae bacterium]
MAESLARTRMSLLGRLRESGADQGAWSEFVAWYAPLIQTWCQRWKLQDADAQEVTQLVLVKLADKMRTFQYDPARSFRAYLKTLAHYAWCDFLEARKRHGGGVGGSEMLDVLHGVAADEDLDKRLDADFDREILTEAMVRVEARVEPHTWQAFRLTALDGLSGADVAGRLDMKVATVFKARSKVQKMLQEEVTKLEEAWG